MPQPETDFGIEILPFSRWPEAAGIVAQNSQMKMPVNPRKDTFLAAEEGGQIIGLAHIEVVHHLNLLWTHPLVRQTRLAYRMIGAVDERMKRVGGGSVLIATDFPSDTLARFMDAYDVRAASHWRKDY